MCPGLSIAIERTTQPCAKRPKCAHVARCRGSHGFLEGVFRDSGSSGSPEAVLLAGRCAVDNVNVIGQAFEEATYLLRGILEVIVEGDDTGVTGFPDSQQQRIVLTEIAHEPEAEDMPVVLAGRVSRSPTSSGPTSVIHEHDFVWHAVLLERLRQSRQQQGKGCLRPMYGDDGRNPGRELVGSCGHAQCNVAPPLYFGGSGTFVSRP